MVTGETGAGKTMVVTSLHLLSGARADAGRVRLGAAKAVVEGRFGTDDLDDTAAAAAADVLDAAGAERDDDGTVIVVRSVGADGRSRAHLGGRSVPAGVLAAFTESMLTVHGQNDQLRLLRPEEQRRALDRFAADTVGHKLARYRTLRREWLELRTELVERTERGRELAQEADRLRHELAEIDAVAPTAGEDVEIVAEVRRLSDLDSLRDAANTAQAAISGADNASGRDDTAADTTGALDLLGTARARLDGADDPALAALGPRLDEAMTVVADVAADLGGYLADLPDDAAALDSLLTRQAELKTLTRKYAPDVDGVLAWSDEARGRLDRIDVSDEALTDLRARVDTAAKTVADAATKLSAARTAAAKKLAKAVSAELSGLAMGKARLDVAIREMAVRETSSGAQDSAALEVDGRTVHAGRDGVDEVEFRLAGHAGAAALPIGKSASGGELSRVMLALEVVLAGSEKGATMVFDEVDAGVGGRAAVEIGRRLARLARTHQVIVVTHLPQVAAFADTHLVVDKSERKGGIVSGVRELDDDQRVVELARMLAGLDDTETGRAHAEELLALANTERRS